MNIVNKPIVTARATAAGLVDSELRVGVHSSSRQGGHELEVRGLGATTAEGSKHCPSTSSGLVLELEVLAAVGCFTAARPTFMHPSVERNVGSAGKVDNR